MSSKSGYYSDLFELTKPRICLLALLMATLGFLLGTDGPLSFMSLTWMLLGTGLVGASSCIFNQYVEIDIDSRMWRTMNRPLVSGRVAEKDALMFGITLGVIGEVILIAFVNEATAVLGALTLLLYIAVYTPSKKITPLSTIIGAVPGAFPPLMGWTAAHGSVSIEGLLLFAILLLWQIPHFLAIAWIYREDYARAELPILSVVDEKGSATAKQIILYSIALLPLTLVPSVWGMMGQAYLFGALILGSIFLFCGILLAVHRTKFYARILFIVSIIYLPALGILMVWDRVG